MSSRFASRHAGHGRLTIAVSCFSVVLLAATAGATTFAVEAKLPDLLATNGVCSLREAIVNANDDAATWPDCPAGSGADLIELPTGRYTMTGGLTVLDALTIRGQGAGATILDGGGEFGLAVGPHPLVVRGLTVTGGFIVLWEDDSSLKVYDSAITRSVAPFIGFAVVVWGGDLLLVNSVISDANYGGILLDEATAALVNSVVSKGDRDGIVLGKSTATLVNTTISGLGRLGGCSKEGCYGFPIDVREDSSLLLVNSTVAGNFFGPAIAGIGTVTLLHSVVSHPDWNCGSGLTLVSGGYNIAADGTCNLTEPTDLPHTDPLLGPLRGNGGPTQTHALLPGSPAIDAIPLSDCRYDDDGDPGTPDVPLATDQRGVSRPQGAGCDVGAYESEPGVPTPTATPTPTVTPTPTATPTPTPLPVGDLPMCKSRRGKQTTVLVPPSKVQRSLDKGATPGECPNAANGRLMCKSKRGKTTTVLVPHAKVLRSLDKGMTLGVCRAW